eukprot:COSAG02_NODE_2155_length_9651_cov_112.913544_5_plen_108_part_00
MARFRGGRPIGAGLWGLYVSECKLVVLKMRRADLIIDDLLSMLCLKLDDVFYVRTEGDRAITVRDLSNGKMLMPEPPGVQLRRIFIRGRKPQCLSAMLSVVASVALH